MFVRKSCFGLGAWILAAPLAFAIHADDGGILVRVSAPERVEPARLKSGSVLEGAIERPVFAGLHEVLPAGTRFRLVIAEAVRQRQPSPGLMRRFASLATGAPRPKDAYAVSVETATLALPGGKTVDTRADVLAIFDERRLHANSRAAGEKKRLSTIVVRLPDGFIATEVPAALPPAGAEIPAGTRVRVMLLGPLNASASRRDDAVEARLLEPLRLSDGTAFPAGSSFDGHVTAAQGPRRLYRPARVRLNFNRLRLPDGTEAPVSTVVSAAGVEQGAGSAMDAEGGVSGGPAGKARVAIHLGMAYAAGKAVDDLLEEGIKWGFGAAVSGTAATVARYVGLGTGLAFLALQRGRDVRLPQYSELELTLTRPLVVQRGGR